MSTFSKALLILALLGASVDLARSDGISNSGVVPGQLPGIATNTPAAAGNVGEVIPANRARASALALTTATPANVASASFTAGNWMICATVGFTGGATTLAAAGGYNTTTGALPTRDSNQIALASSISVGVDDWIISIPCNNVLLSAPTTYFLVAQGTFATGTASAYGTLIGYRIR